MSNEIVKVYEDVPRAGTFLIAKGFDRKHGNLTRLVDKYRKDFEMFGSLKERKIKTKGRPVIEFWLNENQVILLGTYLRNSDIVRAFKIKLVKEFQALKTKLNQLLKSQKTDTYKLERNASKLIRRTSTDTIKRFEDYAIVQGSKNAKRYYSSITRMMNGMLFIITGKFKNLREVMTVQQLMTIGTADQIIAKGLDDGMKAKLYYRDIYQDIKKRVETFAELHGKSEVIAQCLLTDANT